MPVEIAYFHSSELIDPFKFAPIWELKLTNFSLVVIFMNLISQVNLSFVTNKWLMAFSFLICCLVICNTQRWKYATSNGYFNLIHIYSIFQRISQKRRYSKAKSLVFSTMKELFVCIEYLKRYSALKFDYFFYTPYSALTVCVRNINLYKLFWSFASKFLAILLCIFLKIPLNESLLFSYHICCFWAKSNKSRRSYSELQRIIRRSVNVPFWI